MYYSKSDDEKYKGLESGGGKVTTSTGLPYSYGFNLTDARRLVAIADCLDCSLDYLFCRTDEPRCKAAEPDASAPVIAASWHTGIPPKYGDYIVKIMLNGDPNKTRKEVLYYNRRENVWEFDTGEPLDQDRARVVSWIQLPEDEE